MNFNELKSGEYIIPEGFEADIKDGELIVREKESKDERVRKALLRCCDDWEKGQFGCMAKEDVSAIRAYLKKPKEQKPAEWSEKDEETLEKLHRLLVICRGEKKFIQEADYNKMDNFLKSLRPQPKQEWGKVDKNRLEEAIKVVEANGCWVRSDDAVKQVSDFLKSLPERFNLQLMQEWSEDDENKIESIKGLITMGKFVDTNTIKTIWKLLDSLRPQPHWKPSEEQMGSLNYAYCELFKREDVGHNILGPLQKLCDELKKL